MLHGRRLRPAFARRLRRRMRAHRQRDTPPGQVNMDAGRGHCPRHVPAAVLPVLRGGHRRIRQGHRLEALRRRRWRVPPRHRDQDSILRRAQPGDRAARRLAWHQAEALARGGPRVQHLRDRKLRRPYRSRPRCRSDRVPLRTHGRLPQGAQGVRDAGRDVRLQGQARGGPSHRHLHHRACGRGWRRRRRDLTRQDERQDPRSQSMGGDRRRRRGAARRSSGERGERDCLWIIQRAA